MKKSFDKDYVLVHYFGVNRLPVIEDSLCITNH